MRYAGGSAVRQHTHAIADAEGFVGRLGDRDQAPRIKLDRDFAALLAGDRFFRRGAAQPAEHRADGRTDHAAAAAADAAPGNAADDGPGPGADRGFRALEVDVAHRLDDAHLHVLHDAGLLTAVAAADSSRTAGQQNGDGGDGKEDELLVHEGASFYWY